MLSSATTTVTASTSSALLCESSSLLPAAWGRGRSDGRFFIDAVAAAAVSEVAAGLSGFVREAPWGGQGSDA